MLNVGDTIQINGRKAIVCYTTTYNDENYICAAFLLQGAENGVG